MAVAFLAVRRIRAFEPSLAVGARTRGFFGVAGSDRTVSGISPQKRICRPLMRARTNRFDVPSHTMKTG
jgi:hypothetical protein